MKKVLIPVDGSGNCRAALRQVVAEFMNDTGMEIHLLNVQPAFSNDISRFVAARNRKDFHQEQSRKALAPAEELLNRFGVPFATHMAVGQRADCITDTAKRLHCDVIVMGTARKNSLTRLVENSVTNQILEKTTVPVEIVAGDSMSPWEKYGIPAALGAALALVFAIED